MQKNNTAMHKVLQDLKSLRAKNKIVHISWILSHTHISENKLADKVVKEEVKNASTKVISISNKQLSLSYIKNDIKKIATEEWTEIWKKVKQEQQYSKF